MPRRATSPLELDQRRQAVLDAAVNVFREVGYDATVADIAVAAGIAKGSFYTYFPSKEHLVLALRQRYIEALVAQATGIFERVGSEDLLALADEMVVSLVDLDLEHRDVIKLISRSGSGAAAPEMAEANRRLHEIIEAGIKVGTAAGLFDVPDPWLMAGFLNHAVHGFVEEMIVTDQEFDRDSMIAAAQLLIRRALLKQPG